MGGRVADRGYATASAPADGIALPPNDSRFRNSCCSSPRLTISCTSTAPTPRYQSQVSWNPGMRDRITAGTPMSTIRMSEAITDGIVFPNAWNMLEFTKRMPVAMPGVIDQSIGSALALLNSLRQSAGGRLEVRVTDQELAFGAVFANRDTASARLYLEYYAYKTRIDSQLRLMLSRQDGGWLDHFREQLDALWDDAKPADLSSSEMIEE